ncbi:hypothetical protein ROS50_004281 [Citrobacter freundii]|nr:hypothetical protein [Citrobacter freundii]
MTHKTKATMPGRQCSTENKEQKQDTRPAAGGQSLTTPEITEADNLLKGKQSVKLRLVSPEITGTAPLARFTPVLAFTPRRGTALQHTQSPEFSVATISQIVGCILNIRQYFPQWGECDPVAHTLLLRTSLGCVQILPLCSPVLANSNIECRGQRNFAPAVFTHDFVDLTYTKNAGQTPDLAFAQPFGSSLDFLRCRRFISPCMDAMINWEVLSFSTFTNSIASTTSCGTLAFNDCDLAFVVPVAITRSPLIEWTTVYTEKYSLKALTWTTLENYSGPHLDSFKVKTAKPGSARNTNRASNQTVS